MGGGGPKGRRGATATTLPTHPRESSDLPQQAHPQAGFSLIEVMVTLTIIGLAASIMVMTAPPRTPSLDREADRLAIRIAAARDLALIENRAVLIDITETGYDRRIRTFAGWTSPQGETGATPWEPGTTATIPEGRLPAAIMFDAIGLTDPAVLTLIRDGRTETITLDGAGNVTRDRAAP